MELKLITLPSPLIAFAKECIELGQTLPRSSKTLNSYVNDAIGYRMTPEQILYFSDNCFGTADAICFREDLMLLRIHDLKTGAHPCDVRQLMIYAADFCLEQQISPYDISFELRIYQNNEYKQWNPSSDDINVIMNALKRNSKIILNKMKREE